MEEKVRKGRGRSTGVFSFISRIPYSFMVVFNEDDGVPCSPITCSFHAGKKEKVQVELQHVQEASSDSVLLSSETWKANWI